MTNTINHTTLRIIYDNLSAEARATILFTLDTELMSAIRAQLPTSWQYNLKNYKSQDMLDPEFEIYPEIREFDRPVWGTLFQFSVSR